MMKKTILILVAMLAISASAFAAPVLVNGDFETTPVAWTGGGLAAPPADNNIPGWTMYWYLQNGTQVVPPGSQTDLSVTYGALGANTQGGTTSAHGGAYSSAIYAKGGDQAGEYICLYQTISGFEIGHQYKLDGWWQIYSDVVPNASTWFINAIGVQAGAWTYANTHGDITKAYPADTSAIWYGKDVSTPGKAWEQLDTSALKQGNNVWTATDTTYTIWMKAAVNSPSSGSAKERLRVDDLTLTDLTPPPVPEPGSLLALGTGLLGLAGVIRRRR